MIEQEFVIWSEPHHAWLGPYGESPTKRIRWAGRFTATRALQIVAGASADLEEHELPRLYMFPVPYPWLPERPTAEKTPESAK